MSLTASHFQKLDYSELLGWRDADFDAALSAYRKSVPLDGWPDPATAHQAREFFEKNFVPVLISDGNNAHFTGYYEPEYSGSLTQSEKYFCPVFGLVETSLTRKEIDQGTALNGHELVWLSDPVDRYFLQVQGSGRIILDSGEVLRLGYAGRNGHPYVSIGQELIRDGLLEAETISAQLVADWLRRHPDQGREIMWRNPSFVFFQKVSGASDQTGPIGTAGCPVTANVSIAVDTGFVPLGAPVWIEVASAAPFSSLTIAQDTGSAIKGPQRADIFMGTGSDAGEKAGQMNSGGRLVVLLPIGLAAELCAVGDT